MSPTPEAEGREPARRATVYCIDTSALVNMARRYSPMDSPPFRPLWFRVEQLVAEGLLISPDEVRREIEAGQDELVEWVRRNPGLFVPTTPELVEMTKELVRKHVGLAGLDKMRVHADPWVISLAILQSDLFHESAVVADESPRRPTAIPAVCKAEGIECLSHVDWFGREGWTLG